MDLGQAAPQASTFAGWLEQAKITGQEPATQLEALRRAAEAAGDDIALFDEVARLATDTPNHDAWLSQLDSQAATDNSAAAFIRLAHAYALAGDWEAAHDSCERALAQSPQDAALRVDTLSAANNAKRLTAALNHVRVLEDDDAADIDDVDRAWLVAFKAMLLGQLGEFDQASALLRLESFASLPTERLNLALVKGFQAWVKALFEAQRWRELCAVVDVMTAWQVPTVRRLDILSCQVVALFALGDPSALMEPALEMLASASDAVDRAQAHFFLGFAHEAKGDLEAAASSAEIAYEALGQSADAQLARALHARACLALGRAQEALLSAEGIDPNLLPANAVWLAHYLHGMALLRVGSFDPAAAVLRIAAEQSAASHERGLALAELALAHEARDRLDAALETAQRARALLRGESTSPELARARASTAMVMARVWSLRGRHVEALKALREAESARPGLAQQLLFVELAWSAFVGLGRNDEARALIERTARDAELADHPQFLLLVAINARNRNELDYAHTALTAATSVPSRLTDDHAAALAATAAQLALGRIKEAEALLDALARQPGVSASVSLPFWRLLCQFHLRRYRDRDEAARELDALAGATGAQSLLVHAMRHELLASSGRFAEALPAADQALTILRTLPQTAAAPLIQIQYARATTLIALAAPVEAISALSEAIASQTQGDPLAGAYRDMALMLRATAWFSAGRPAECLADVQSARRSLREKRAELALAQDPWGNAERRAALLEAQALNALGRPEESLAAVGSLLGERDPLQPIALVLRGEALLQLQDWQRAAESFVLARAYLHELGSPAHGARVALHTRLGEARARIQNGQHAEAIALLQVALENDAELASVCAELWLLLGISYHADGRFGPALQAIERAHHQVESDPHDEPTPLAVAIAVAHSAALIKLGKHSQSLAVIQALGTSASRHGALQHNRGVASLELFRDTRHGPLLSSAREAFAVAGQLGLRAASDALRHVQAPVPALVGWLGPAGALPTRAAGGAIALLAALVLFVVPLAGFWTADGVDWRLYPFPAVAALLLVFLPRWRSNTTDGPEASFAAEPVADSVSATRPVHANLVQALSEPRTTSLPPHYDALMFGEIVRTPVADAFRTLRNDP